MPVRLEWRRESGGLNVAVINLGTKAVRDASLSVIDIRMRSTAGAFVEVPGFDRTGPFNENWCASNYRLALHTDLAPKTRGRLSRNRFVPT